MQAVKLFPHIALERVDKPIRRPGEVLIRVNRAGICNTDLELSRGYVPDFHYIGGHEFYGYVEEADNEKLIGKRVTAEINEGCGTCEYCRRNLARHCPHRRVLGIVSKDGAFAEYCLVPVNTLVLIPETISDDQAIFIEPLAAACEIVEQIPELGTKSILILGDGKLAALIALVLSRKSQMVTLCGKHPEKIHRIKKIATFSELPHEDFQKHTRNFDIVVEATGNPSSLSTSIDLVKPRGTIVVKSTYAAQCQVDMSRIVVDEITVIGSRCGQFKDAIAFIERYSPDLSELISAEYPFSSAAAAFARSTDKDSMKVVLRFR